MPKQFTVEVTDAQALALDIAAVDPGEWVENMVTNRARVEIEELKAKPLWAQAIEAVVAANGDASNDEAVLLKARELGLVKTATEKKAELEAAEKLNLDPPQSAAEVMQAAVKAHALELKITKVNELRIDNGPDYPITKDALDSIRTRYTDIINEVSAKSILGEPVTDDEKQIVSLIRQGFDYFKAVDAAAQAILSAGDPADPLSSDVRWPGA